MQKLLYLMSLFAEIV